MITLITLIKNEQQLDNFKRNLVSLESTFNLGLDILCLVNDKNFYLKVRDYLLLAINRGECRIEYIEGENIKKAKDFITDNNPYVFILDCDYILPMGGIDTLYMNYLEKPNAGFISGMALNFGNAFYWVEDVYDSPYFQGIENIKLKEGLVAVDVSAPRALLTKTYLFKEVYCAENVDGAFDYSFGIKLRRQGYQNYLNTNVKLRQEIK